MSNIKAVILDLDGTLLDTEPDITVAHNRCLRALGYPDIDPKRFGHIIGGGILTAIEKACPPGTPWEKILEYNEMYQAFYPLHCAELTRHYEGMPEFLRLCVDKGVKVAVLSNKTESTTEIIISHYFPDIPFAFVWGNNDVRPLKPEVDAGLEALKLLGIKPEEAAYVGDSDTDMFFANDCGMLSVGACWGYRGRTELEFAGGKVLCDTPMEMASIL